MISLTNYDFQWARSELVIIYPDNMLLVDLQNTSWVYRKMAWYHHGHHGYFSWEMNHGYSTMKNEDLNHGACPGLNLGVNLSMGYQLWAMIDDINRFN